MKIIKSILLSLLPAFGGVLMVFGELDLFLLAYPYT
jgi:hypothetical protein